MRHCQLKKIKVDKFSTFYNLKNIIILLVKTKIRLFTFQA